MKKIIFTSLLLLSLTNLIAQNTPVIQESSSMGSGKAPAAVGDLKLTVRHSGFDGALIKSSSNFSTVDVDAANGDAVVRFARNGSLLWGIGNNPTNDYFRIFEYNLGYPFVIQKNTGAVGIGTQLPSSRLEVSSEGVTDLRISSTAGFGPTRLSFISDKGIVGSEWRPGYIASGDNGGYTGSLNFFTNGTGGASLFGNILGMTLTNKRLSVGGTFVNPNPYALEIHQSNSYGTALYNVTNDTYWEHFVANGSGSNLTLYTNTGFKGSFSSVTGVYTSASDKTLKNNIAAMGSVLDKVLQLQPSTYQFNDNPTNKTSIGFIAQDVEVLFPEFVYKNTMKDGSEIRSMDYAGMSVIALKAIQEQQVLIKELQAEIAKLKNK